MIEYTGTEIRAHILFKLDQKRIWGAKHTAFEHTGKGVPKHMVGRFLDCTKELIRDNFILQKPTHYGLQISLNLKKREEIEKIAEEYGRKEKIIEEEKKKQKIPVAQGD